VLRHARWLLAVALPLPFAAFAQTWNAPPARALVQRAIARRQRAAADTSLHDYKALAHGFVFFLGSFGDGLTQPPRLVKADQLELEVYWKAPSASKQRIIGWRDRADLPTDINYHRDHLGIIQNGFGRVIRLGEGDEVQDIPHPLSPGGPMLYDYALGETTTVSLPGRDVRLVAVQVRPAEFAAPRIVGTLYLDVRTADLVRLEFTFTPAAYRDPQLEDISVVLENALYEGKWWLPYRQEVEIRRRLRWLDLQARGIIRGRWTVDSFAFNLGLADSWFRGEEITAAPKAERDSFPWTTSLDAAVQQVAEPVRQSDLAAVRAEVARIAAGRALSGLPPGRLGVGRVSDLIHQNRVEGLALGAGVVWRPGGGGGSERLELRARGSYGLSDGAGKGSLSVAGALGDGTLRLTGYREIRDLADFPIVAPLVNSITSQEFGDDYGDYYRATGARLAFRQPIDPRWEWEAGAAREHLDGQGVRAVPATGTYRPNPDLGMTGGLDLLTLAIRRKSEGFAVRHDLALDLELESGRRDGGLTYLRLTGDGHVLLPLGAGETRLLLAVQGGAAGEQVPAHRSFVLGGRGTLLGDPLRAWGGRRVLLGHVECRVPLPFGALHLGPYARTPASLTLAPYVATGWAADPVPGTPWTGVVGTRVTAGLALEWLGVFRLEAGYGAQTHDVHMAFDVTRDFWGVL